MVVGTCKLQITCKVIEFLIDKIFVQFGGCFCHQLVGILMAMNCVPLINDLFLYLYENEFVHNMPARNLPVHVIYVTDILI